MILTVYFVGYRRWWT